MPDPADHRDATVTYGVKELLLQFAGQLSRIEDKLDRKASQEQLAELQTRHERLGETLHKRLDQIEKRVEDHERWRARVIGIALGVGIGSGAGATALIKVLGG